MDGQGGSSWEFEFVQLLHRPDRLSCTQTMACVAAHPGRTAWRRMYLIGHELMLSVKACVDSDGERKRGGGECMLGGIRNVGWSCVRVFQ